MAITLLLTGCGCSNSKDKNKDKAKPSATPTPNGTILGDQKVGELEITDFSVANKDGMSNLVANVKNISKADISLRMIIIKLYDKENKLIVASEGYIGDSIKAGETKTFQTQVTQEIKNAVKAEYEILK